MRLAQVVSGVVVNVIEVDPSGVPDWAEGWPVAETAGPGWTFDGDTFSPPDPPPPVVPDEVKKLALVKALRIVTLAGEPDPAPGADAWTAVKAALAAASDEVRENWDLAQAIPRDDADFQAMAVALSVPSAVLDGVFILADAIDRGLA